LLRRDYAPIEHWPPLQQSQSQQSPAAAFPWLQQSHALWLQQEQLLALRLVIVSVDAWAMVTAKTNTPNIASTFDFDFIFTSSRVGWGGRHTSASFTHAPITAGTGLS
jgi:hypothetical protein